MIDINQALQNVLKAVYGRDVRQSIHDAIYQINQNANEAVELSQIKFGNEITSPTDPIGDYIEKTVYFNIVTGIIWRLEGGSWSRLGSMRTIDNIKNTKTEGLIDTYTIYYNDGNIDTYTIKNGEKGTSIENIRLVSTVGNINHYEVLLSDGTTTPNGFDVTNGIDGVSITNITLASTVGNVKNYEVNLSNGQKTPNGFSVADGISNYIYIRYSANFDGQGMVTVPSDQTVYIGICVTTQPSAPTDPAVYSWVRFIGKSGTGTGDMLKSDYSTIYDKVVDKAAALFDGTREISASQLMTKDDYAEAELPGVVKQAAGLVDKKNNKEADTEILANFSEDENGLKYKGEKVGGEVLVDDETITKNEAGELEVADAVTAKLATIDGKVDKPTGIAQGKVATADGNGGVEWEDAKGRIDYDVVGGSAWNSGKSYVVKDTCIYNDKVYSCIKAHTSSASIVPTNTTYWEVISLKVLNEKIGQGGSGGGFFEQDLSVTAESELVGQNYYIYQLDEQGNTSPNYARSGKIIGSDTWKVGCLGSYSVRNETEEIGNFVLDSFPSTPSIPIVLELGVANALVPIMTSNTTPSGQALYYGNAYNSVTQPAYICFNGKGSLDGGGNAFTSINWKNGGPNPLVGYDFGRNVYVKKFDYKGRNDSYRGMNLTKLKIQGSSDNFVNDVHDLTDELTVPYPDGSVMNTMNIKYIGAYRYIRIMGIEYGGGGGYGVAIASVVQFYGH